MNKIKALLEKCGLSEEAANSVCEAIQKHTDSVRESFEGEYAKRAEAAKRICVDETERHKLELARRLQIFCEAKVTQINQIIAKQAQLREGQAVQMLEQVKGLLEGISINDDTGLKREYLELKEEFTRVKKERDGAITQANRQTKLAEKVLRRNRILESKAATQPIVTEASTIPNQPIRARGTRPLSTRPTLTENQDRRQPVDSRHGNTVRNDNRQSVVSPAQIAASMDE